MTKRRETITKKRQAGRAKTPVPSDHALDDFSEVAWRETASFQFDADAKAVVDSMMQGAGEREFETESDPDLWATMFAAATADADYALRLRLTGWDNERESSFGLPELLAEVRLKEQEPGKCTAHLYVEDLEAPLIISPRGLTKPSGTKKTLLEQFLWEIWRRLKEEGRGKERAPKQKRKKRREPTDNDLKFAQLWNEGKPAYKIKAEFQFENVNSVYNYASLLRNHYPSLGIKKRR